MILLTMIFNAVVSLLVILGIYVVIDLAIVVVLAIIFGLYLKLICPEDKREETNRYWEGVVPFASSLIAIIPTFLVIVEIKQYLP